MIEKKELAATIEKLSEWEWGDNPCEHITDEFWREANKNGAQIVLEGMDEDHHPFVHIDKGDEPNEPYTIGCSVNDVYLFLDLEYALRAGAEKGFYEDADRAAFAKFLREMAALYEAS